MEKMVNPGIKNISIRNFKSVKSLSLTDCRRINVLIGRPNVGKSNILEALALFDVPYMVGASDKSLKILLRVDTTPDLFHNGNVAEKIEVTVDTLSASVSRNTNNGISVEIAGKSEISKYLFNSSLNLTTKKEPVFYPPVLTYFFPKYFTAESVNIGFLLPPSGSNLMETVATLPELKISLASLFHSYGLKMMFDSGSQQIRAVREDGLDMFLIPFGSLADSLQRLIFYKAAIVSNHGKMICFEEPEAHTFPPYIASVVNDIITDASNQYFLTTHSPYVVSELLERGGEELAVFIVDMKNGATVAHRLSDRQIQEAYDNGLDMFFNLEAFLDQ